MDGELWMDILEYLYMKGIKLNINIRDIHGINEVSSAAKTMPALDIPANNPAAELVGD